MPVEREEKNKMTKNHFWKVKFSFLHPGLPFLLRGIAEITEKEFSPYVLHAVDWDWDGKKKVK